MVLDASVVGIMITSERIVQKKVKNFKKGKKQNRTARSNFATFSANNSMNSEDWYLDTGATSHLCSSKDVMNDFVPNNANCVKIAMAIYGIGDWAI